MTTCHILLLSPLCLLFVIFVFGSLLPCFQLSGPFKDNLDSFCRMPPFKQSILPNSAFPKRVTGRERSVNPHWLVILTNDTSFRLDLWGAIMRPGLGLLWHRLSSFLVWIGVRPEL